MKRNRFVIYAWSVLIYNILVILWGAFVRATGSGAGCGNHWPSCGGQVVPRSPQIETLIEFGHRLSSGLALLLIIGLVIWAFRAYPKGHGVRLGAGLSFFFIMVEALIGAGLVRFELVADNASITRALVMAAHLANTFLLLGVLTLTAWGAMVGKPIPLKNQGWPGWALGLGLLGMLILAASGGVTALGDTLFPTSSLAEGLQQKFSPTAHVLIRLRLFHPLLAISVGAYLILVAGLFNLIRPNPVTRRLARGLTILYFIQLGAGALNVYLLAPIWMQLLHLFLSDLIWVVWVLFTVSALVQKTPEPAETVELLKPAPQTG